MTSIKAEKASELFSRFEKNCTVDLERKILPSLSLQDIVQISGGPGSGKTELLYHFILRCILPESPWHGLNMKVIFIDTDCHFNLLRLIQIFEKKIAPRSGMNKEDLSSFIHSRLKHLEVVKCIDSDELIASLRYVEFLRPQNYILMVDGVTSFYWSLKRRNVLAHSKGLDHQIVSASIIGTISKNGIPVVLTKRVLGPSFDNSNLDSLWQKTSTWTLELEPKEVVESATKVTVKNVMAQLKVEATINNSGFTFHS